MANVYWVTGGNGTWSSSTNWSATSGGASGATAPTSSDVAVFDANSGTGSVTITATTIQGWDTTNSGNTFTGTGIVTIAGGNVIFGSGITLNNSGNMQINTSGVTITSNGKSFPASLIVTTGFAPGGTITLNDNCTFRGATHSVISGVVNINGGNLTLNQTSGTILISSSGRTFAGTSKIVLAGTGTISTAGISNNVDINTAGTITQNSTVTINGGTWTYIAGTWATGTSAVAIGGSCTLNLAGMPIYRITTAAAATVTLTSLLTVIADIQYSLASGFVFAGTHGFTCATLTDNSSSAGRVITLAAGVEYFVTGSLSRQSGYLTSKASIVSGTPGTKAKLNLSHSATQFMPYCNLTDIEATNSTIWVYNGTISNCVNVRLLNYSQPTIASTF